ncbi:MAG: hypothetical protein ABIK07_19085, partial [Planctomycetota bacterium]
GGGTGIAGRKFVSDYVENYQEKRSFFHEIKKPLPIDMGRNLIGKFTHQLHYRATRETREPTSFNIPGNN